MPKAARLQDPLMRAAAWYFLRARTQRGLPVDAVARFHLGNGARLERINWLADTSDKAMAQAHGLMVNYHYDLDDIEKNHEAYAEGRTVVAANGVQRLLRPPLELVPIAGWVTGFPIHRHDGAARDAVVGRGEKQDRRRHFLDLRPGVEIGFRHRLAIGRRIHDRGRHRIDQNAVFGDFLGQRHGERGDARFGDRIGGHAGAGARIPAPAAPLH